eukprot:1182687-Prorocentrum_minimum.AAC.13
MHTAHQTQNLELSQNNIEKLPKAPGAVGTWGKEVKGSIGTYANFNHHNLTQWRSRIWTPAITRAVSWFPSKQRDSAQFGHQGVGEAN